MNLIQKRLIIAMCNDFNRKHQIYAIHKENLCWKSIMTSDTQKLSFSKGIYIRSLDNHIFNFYGIQGPFKEANDSMMTGKWESISIQ